MKKRTKKAVYYAALIYLACAALGFGLLRTAQQTRRTLYGGHPVMAFRTSDGTVTLGGGEWTLAPELPAFAEKAEALSEKLPPCTAKYILHLTAFCESLADQTAAKLRGSGACVS